MPLITASILYNLVQCPKRVELDLFGTAAERDEPNAFVEMLWERGTIYEREVMSEGGLVALDLSQTEPDAREGRTLEAMRQGEQLIYGGRISADDLLGVPDLLRKAGDGYVPIDIKSGRGKAGGVDSDDGDAKYKLHYAVQLALYVDILERLGLSAGRRGVILDIQGREVLYDLADTRGPRVPDSLWQEYQALLADARSIVSAAVVPRGAMASSCKLCHWHTKCSSSLRADSDLTLIPGLGRSFRDAMADQFPTLEALAECNPEAFITKGKTLFKNVGEKRLITFHRRARLLNDPDGRPYLTAPISLPVSDVELFFDIEVDPLRDLTYLHGIIERRNGDAASERFIAFFTDEETPEAERGGFAAAVAFLTSKPTATIWYYSKYEPTIYRKLAARYPDACPPGALDQIFDPSRAVDLYFDVVAKATEWPTNDHSIKTLAKYLGFDWRDQNPSGAASIQWFDQWVKSRDPSVRQRILDYNEDDCRATRVLLDGIRSLTE
jgi:predicted RecB family nuclease